MIDLYLGGDMGLWSLETAIGTQCEAIRQVLTIDEQIARAAQDLGLRVLLGDAKKLQFKPAAVGLSIHYPRILSPALIASYERIYNLHPGYLPWGRGYFPIFWALWEGTAAGATLHKLTPGIDEGPIVAQTRVLYDDCDTGGSLFARVRQAEKVLFVEYWTKIVQGQELSSTPQPEGGSFHRKNEFYQLKQNANLELLTARDLVKLIRCLTIPGYSGLEVLQGGRRYQIKLESLDPPADLRDRNPSP